MLVSPAASFAFGVGDGVGDIIGPGETVGLGDGLSFGLGIGETVGLGDGISIGVGVGDGVSCAEVIINEPAENTILAPIVNTAFFVILPPNFLIMISDYFFKGLLFTFRKPCATQEKSVISTFTLFTKNFSSYLLHKIDTARTYRYTT